MLVKKKLNSRNAQAGVTLIELMISIALGLLLLGAATAMTVSSMVMNGDTLKSARLNQDLDSVLQIMVNDIRRAGYSDNFDPALAGVVYDTVDSGLDKVSEDLNIVSPDCVLYSYNANGDGIKDEEEKFGFKLVGFEIHMRTKCPDSAGTSCITSCSVGTWVALTDRNTISIKPVPPITDITFTGLRFDSVNSKCLNITHSSNEIIPGNKNNFWVTKTSVPPETEFPCLATTDTNLENYILDASGAYVAGAYVAPGEDDRLIGVRQVNVRIEGNLTNDPPMIKRQLVAINVRNNRVTVVEP